MGAQVSGFTQGENHGFGVAQGRIANANFIFMKRFIFIIIVQEKKLFAYVILVLKIGPFEVGCYKLLRDLLSKY